LERRHRLHSPLTDERLVGADTLEAYVVGLLGAFSDFHLELDDFIVDNDRAVLRLIQTGRHTGDYFGIPATGKTVRVTEVFIFRFAPGGPLGLQAEEVWLVLNALHLIQQLGLFPRGNPPRALLRGVIGIQNLSRRLRGRA